MSDPQDERTVSVKLRRLDLERQARLDRLMEKNNEGILSREEREELRGLVAEYEEALVQNTQTLLRATRPDLLAESGQIDRSLLASAVRRVARAVQASDGE